MKFYQDKESHLPNKRKTRVMRHKIEIEKLSKRFGSILAVDGIDLQFDDGEVIGLLGPNGAGKSTTMRMIAGFLTPTSGRAHVCGHDVTTNPVSVKACIGYLPEGAPAYGDMTPFHFLKFTASIRGFDGKKRRTCIEETVEKTGLENVLYRPIDTLSKGFKRRVGLAQAILHDPEVLILDEPTDGLDPNQKRQVRDLIVQMSAHKVIIISTHSFEEVEAVCSRAVIIGDGRILIDEPPNSLLARSRCHNAVRIKIKIPDAKTKQISSSLNSKKTDVKKVNVKKSNEGVKQVLCQLNGVAHVKQENDAFLVIPKDGAEIAGAVSEQLHRDGIIIREMSIEHGSLDEVFRYITRNVHEQEEIHA